MAGSIQWFTYTADDNATYGVKIDKSNAAVLGFAAAVNGTQPLPRGWSMRQVNCVQVSAGEGQGFYRRSFPVGSLAATAWTTSATFDAAGRTWQPVSRSGEGKRFAFVLDTALTDA